MAAKRKTTKKTTKKKVNKDMLLVGSKVKAALKESDVNVSADAIEGLNEWVYLLIEQATRRAEANGRKTVRAHDFMS
jgi:histone H3/H4